MNNYVVNTTHLLLVYLFNFSAVFASIVVGKSYHFVIHFLLFPLLPVGWDLEYNKVIRHYHGHLSGVFCLNVHPVLDVLVTGGRDSVARVWDMRTKHQIHVLGGHTNAVSSLICSGADPQVITGSHDSTIKVNSYCCSGHTISCEVIWADECTHNPCLSTYFPCLAALHNTFLSYCLW